MRTMFKVWQRPPSALLDLAAQPMQAMVLPLVQGCWGLASEPWSAVRSHRKRCTSRRRRRSTTHRLHLFTSRRLSTWRPSTLDRGITVVHIEVIGASATFGFPFKDAMFAILHARGVVVTDLSFSKIPSAGDLATRLSLLCGKQFPVTSRKFPVQLRREFRCNQLTYGRKTEHRPAFAVRSAKFPVFSRLTGKFPLRRVRC